MAEEIELEIDEDGVAHLHKQKPTVELEFPSEDMLIDWLSDMANKKLFPEDVRCAFENIESDDFLDRLNSKIECGEDQE